MPIAAEERTARELLRSVVGELDAAIYETFGFLAIQEEGAGYGYLIYPQRPVVSYDAESGELLSEYCVRFRDQTERLADADDVLAKWMALRNDEAHVLGIANIDPIGTQLDPEMVRRDLEAMRQWQR